MSPPAGVDALPQEDHAAATSLKREASQSSVSTSQILKIFLHENEAKTPFGFVKIQKPVEPLNLLQLKPIIEAQLDPPSSNAPEKSCGQKRTASEAEVTQWSDLKYRFYFDGMPVSKKQETLLKFPDDFQTTSELGISFDSSKRQKLEDGGEEQGKEKEKEEEKFLEQKEEDLPFKVEKQEIISCKTNEVIGHENVLTFDNDFDNPEKTKIVELCNLLRNITQNATFYNKDPKMKEDLFFQHLQKLKNSANSEYNKQLLDPLIKYLEKKFEDTLKSMEKMLANKQITFTCLWYLFPKDSKFTATLQGELVGSTVVETRYQHSFFGTSFQVAGQFIKSNGVGLSNFNKWFSIEEFEGLLDIKELPIQPMTEEKLAKLNERGKMFREVSLGTHYLQYHGSMNIQQWFMVQKFKADGRIMVDPVSFNRFNPNYQGFRFNTDEEKGVDTLSDEKLFMTWPSVAGFSFATKKWGEFLISNISPVKFDKEAFDRLVLDEDRKRLMKCLVQNSSKAFSDIISGKGGGVIFLLHGPPGTGKTVSAESLSELLRRPLYCVNVGEIGVTTQQLEDKLSQILEMASTWNAIILLDEADIFLERRTDNDIERNALVGIFLRLLEYHQGVMFLTTNRVKSFDEAFHSRISIALHYQALDKVARKKVWENLLDAAKVEGDLDPEELSNYELNGRQIKNVIRLAQTIAFEEHKPVSKDDIAKCVEVARQFQQDLTL